MAVGYEALFIGFVGFLAVLADLAGETLSEDEAARVEERVKRLVQERKREEVTNETRA